MRRRHELRIGWILVLLTLLVCGGDDATREPQAASVEKAEAETGKPAAESGSEPSAEPGSADEGDVLDPESLSESASIEIKQYSVAYIGSGTLGKGTLVYRGRRYPFRIGGLGIGGIGVASIDAHGFVYDLPDLASFPGTYGNARVGATAADAGKGRLWLKNTNGVVLKLWTEMKGLALTAGVDGIVITWESDVRQAVGDVKQGAKEAWNEVKGETQKGWKSVKDTLR